MTSWGHILAGLATTWTLGLWATAQEINRRRRRLDRAEGEPAGPAVWPHLTCACPLDGGDAADAFGELPAPAARRGLWAYPGALHVVFLAASDDPAAQARAQAHAGQLRARGLAAEAVVTFAHGRNRKASQLAQLPAPASPDALVLALDSDVSPASVNAAQLVARLVADPALGVAWQATAPAESGQGLGDYVTSAVLGAGTLAMPLLAALDGNSPVGKVLAYRAAAVAQIGGWAAVQEELGDDVGLGVRLRGAGYAIATLPGPPASAPRRGQRLRDVCRRLSRWQAVVRAQRPGLLWTYPGYLAFSPLLLGLWALAGSCGAPGAWVFLGAAWATGTRLQLAVLARRSCRHAVRPLRLPVDAVVGDLTLLALFFGGAWRRSAYWNGRSWGQAPR